VTPRQRFSSISAPAKSSDVGRRKAAGTLGDDERATAAVARLERLPIFGFHLRLAALLGTGTLLDSFDALAIAVTLPVIVSSFDLDVGSVGWLISAAYAGQLLGSVLFGWLAERAGRRTAYIGSLVVMGVFSLAAAVSWSAGSLGVARVLTGIGLGGEVPIAAALFSEYAQARRRGLLTMLWETSYIWGFLVTPLVALGLISALGPEAGWRTVFALGGLSLIAALAALRWLPESVRWLVRSNRLDEAERTLVAIEDEATDEGRTLPDTQVQPPPDIAPTRWREPLGAAYRGRTLLIWTLTFTDFFATYGIAVWLPTLYVTLGGLPPTASLALTAITGVLQLIAAYLFATTVDRFGRRPWFVFGLSLAAVSAGAGLIASSLGLTAWPTLFAVGAGTLFGLTPVSMGVFLYAGELYPTRMRAWGTALAGGWIRIAAFVAPLAVAGVLGAGWGIQGVFVMFAIATSAGAVVMLARGPETRQRVLEELAA
jgi:putative MFS transporter